MLRLIATDHHDSERRNLQIARAHIESAIAHINDAAQGRNGANTVSGFDTRPSPARHGTSPIVCADVRSR
jgi:hypothetical protein